MSKSDVIYVKDIAEMYGRTESAVRSAVQRGGADWLPPRLAMRRIAWLRSTAVQFLHDLENKQLKKDAVTT